MGEYKNVPQEINDVVSDNIKKLAQLFPSAVKDGQLDIDALKEELGTFEEVGKEKYEFTWSGKQNAKKIAQQDVFGKTLKFCPEKSKNADTTENIYIEGDNLEALKLLRQNYYNSIKMIYIDPPYNTGNDFVYNDDYSMSQEESDIAEGVVDELGERYTKNVSGNRFHANWCNMIYPRLKLAKDLLTDDGVIFISIDGNEYKNLIELCNEVFSEKNCLGTIILQTATDNNPTQINQEHEYMICYCKDFNVQSAWYRTSQSAKLIQNQYEKIKKNTSDTVQIQQQLRAWIKDNRKLLPQVQHYNCVDEKGVYSSSSNSSNPHPGGYTYDILHPVTRMPCPKPQNGWRWAESTFLDYAKSGEIHWGNDHNSQPHIKKRLFTAKEQLKSVIYEDNRAETKMLSDIFDGKKIFENPKPHNVISRIVDFVTSKDDIILDFFSGSATTAHAVMQLNAEDGGNRKFIMVQLEEKTDEKSEAHKAGYNTICEIGEERIRRAGDKIKAEHPDANIDIGFKAFEIADTNIKWNEFELKDEQIDFANLSNNPDQVDFKQDTKDIDVVYEIMLRQKNIPLSSKIEVLDEIGFRTYLYADSYLICLETQVTNEMIDKLASLDPTPFKYIFRDSAFKDDIDLKTNAFRRLKAMVEKHAGATKKAYTVEFI